MTSPTVSPDSPTPGRARAALWALVAVALTFPSALLLSRGWPGDAEDSARADASTLAPATVPKLDLPPTAPRPVPPPPDKNRIQAAQALVQQSPTASNYLALGYAYLQQNQPAASLSPLDEAARLEPSNDVVYNNLCVAHQLLGNSAEAQKACKHAIELNPKNQLARNNLAWVTSSATPQAQAAGTPAPRPSQEDELLQQGLTLYQRGEYDKSIQTWRQILATNPNSARAYNNIGTSLMQQGKHDEALGMFNKATSLDPQVALYRNNLAWADSARAASKRR